MHEAGGSSGLGQDGCFYGLGQDGCSSAWLQEKVALVFVLFFVLISFFIASGQQIPAYPA